MLTIYIISRDFNFIEKVYNTVSKSSNKIKIVGICGNEDEAIEFLSNNTVDTIMLDLDMLNPNSNILLKKLKYRIRNIKIISTSSNPESVITVVNYNLNMFHFITKPVDTVELLETLNKLSLVINSSMNKLEVLLENFTFNKSTLGYRFIIDSLTYCINSNCNYIANMQNFYPKVVSLYNDEISARKIGWDISKAISTMYDLSDKEVITKYFKTTNKITPKRFFNTILQNVTL